MTNRKSSAAGIKPAASAAASAAPAIPMATSIDDLLERIEAQPGAVARLGLKVTGPRLGRRRAGRSFGQEPVTIPLEGLDEASLRAIDGDPQLAWAIVMLEEAEAASA